MALIVQNWIELLKEMIINNNIYLSFLVGFLVTVLESILPFLPLAVFIAINKMVFGTIIGFLLSWIGTIIGCIIAFTIFRKGFSSILYKNITKNETKKLMNKISNIKFTTLVMITALPFTPAFTINIAAGLSKISYKKFISAIIISKLSIVYFWGYIGTTFVESITNVVVLIRTIILLLIVYIISKTINKNFNIK